MPAANPYVDYATDANSPSRDLIDIAPDDNNDLPSVIRQVHVGTGGNLRVRTISGSIRTLKNLSSGQVAGPFFIDRVLATGTTATDLVGYI